MEDAVAALDGCIEENKAIVAASDSNVMKQADWFAIYVSPHLSPERKRFFIAQELFWSATIINKIWTLIKIRL